MGRSLIFDFRRWNHSDYYMCKFCFCHIALHQDFSFIMHQDPVIQQDNEKQGEEGIFTQVYNVKVDEADKHEKLGRYTVADIYCTRCKAKLGCKYINVGSGPTQINKGNLKLIMGRLMRRQGDELVDMATMERYNGSEDNFTWTIRDTPEIHHEPNANENVQMDEVDFRDRNSTDYYMCKLCGLHIALHEHLQFTHQGNEENGGIFTEVYNVKVDEADKHQQVDQYTVADIYCTRCNNKLGCEYIEVGSDPTQIEKGNLKLIMATLMRRQGDQLVDMETMHRFNSSENNFDFPIRDTPDETNVEYVKIRTKSEVDFRDKNRSDYYMCKLCGLHIALHEKFKFMHQDNELHGEGGIFTEVCNVNVDEIEKYYRVGMYTVTNIYCKRCNEKLGCGIVLKEVLLNQIDQVASGSNQIKKGNVKLIMEKLRRRQSDGNNGKV